MSADNSNEFVKRCTRCQVEYPSTEEYFHKSKNGKNGLDSRCRKCKQELYLERKTANPNLCKEQYQKNREKNLARAQKYAQEHSEETKAYQKNYRESHKAELKEYREINKPREAARKKVYNAKNAEKIKIQRKSYRKEHKVEISEYNRNYQKTFPEKFRDYNKHRKYLIKNGTFTNEDWNYCLTTFDGCAYCGGKDGLTKDHVIPLSKGGVNDKTNIVPACTTCNSNKHDMTFEEWFKTTESYSEERETAITVFLNSRKN